MLINTLIFGTGAGIIHFLLVGLLYMNPFAAKMYSAEEGKNGALRVWDNKKHYMILMFSGTMIESWLLCLGYQLLSGAFPRPASWATAIACAVILGLIRVYPRAFDKWIQTTYPHKLIFLEAVNGMIGSMIIVLGMRLLLSLR